jgi:hypothetical protein
MDDPDTASLTPRVLRWRQGGTFVDVAGKRIFVRRRDGARPLLLFLHGFPSSCSPAISTGLSASSSPGWFCSTAA